MKKVLVISTSLRPRSNSEALADEFVRGAQEAGNEVEKVTLRGKDIRFLQRLSGLPEDPGVCDQG